MIHPDWVRTFETLAQLKNFTATARRLGMTQPGVSQHLKKLELELGVPLVGRARGAFQLLPSGERLLEYLRDLSAGEKKLREGLREDRPERGTCRIAAPGSLGLLVYDTLLEVGRECPELRLDLTVAPSLSAERHLEQGEVDLAYLNHMPRSEHLEVTKLAEERLVLVVPRSRVRRRGPLEWSALAAWGLVRHPDGTRLAERLLSANFPRDFRGADRLPSRTSINQINRILEAVAAGLGFTVIQELAYLRSPFREKVELVEMRVPVTDPIVLARARHRELPSRFAFVQGRISEALGASLGRRRSRRG